MPGGLAAYELAHLYAQGLVKGKTPEEIMALFESVIVLNPQNVMGRIYYARWLKVQGKEDRFTEELTWIKTTLKAGQHVSGFLCEIVRAHELLGNDFQDT